MSTNDAYKAAYEREKEARLLAEKLLEDKTRELYENVLDLKATVSELNSTQAQLVQSEKMASLGLLTAGVAHEINNPIAYSYSNLACLSENIHELFKLDKLIHESEESDAEILLKQYKDLRSAIDADYLISDTPELMKDIIDGIERVKTIVNNLKKVSYKGGNDLIYCDINDCIKDCLKVLANELKYSIEVKLSLSECDGILGDPSELNQVFINLFVNALHACDEKGVLTVSTKQNKEKVFIEVKDNGKGIKASEVSKIFDPFYTTKSIGEGTGLGLAVSHGIVVKHKGEIQIKSEENVGTVFTIIFPIAPPQR